ncbi:hypothetical protein FLX08_25840 [Microbispora hainanensis]|uniref:Uncharacterized protein n=2 Tax=Microbispora hainanensis TaxID=568844 RepID=A0A544YN01_9ACTN|nr:hypothetical protein FLX08_25840 [Microbispora hainanensis]
MAKGLTKSSLVSQAFPLRRRSGSRVRSWMDLSFRFCYDPEGEYLTVLSTFVGVYGDAEGEDRLCHFDYERNKADGYPEAHIQVYGASSVLEKWGGNLLERGLHRLHFPAGHRRFRWCLEDVIEFVAREGIADAKPGWAEAIEPGRRRFHQMQLKAAIRRDMDTAIAYLREEGYTIAPPQ